MITMIVCADTQFAIGKDNDLLYNFKEDMQRFKCLTKNKTVVMGRKTWESLPSKLPNRKNVVISSTYIENADYVTTNISDILEMSKNEDIFIIGGASIYSIFRDYADKIEYTKVYDNKPYDTDIKWMEDYLEEFEITYVKFTYAIDRLDNISKKIAYLTYTK